VRLREDNGRTVKTYDRGYPVGFTAAAEPGGAAQHYLNNHARFTILYNRDPETDLSRIVGFEVEPASVKHRYKNRWDPVNPQLETCNAERHPLDSLAAPPQPVAEGEEVVFTYDVVFKASDIRWASRWDTYLQMNDDNIHWFSIVNSLMIVLFLSGMVAMIMVRTLRRDISQYNELESAEEAAEESGWKMVHGDVFRPPPMAGALACAAGTGVQLLGMASVTMCFAVLGFLSPANRGGLMTAMLLLFVLMGVAAGYSSARLYKSFGLVKWRQMTLQTALAYPGFCFLIFFVLNLLIWGQRSSGAVPFGTLIALAALWFGISVPLVFVGSYFGFKKSAPETPVRTNKIPRQVPPQPWYMAPAFSVLVGGILPFGAVFIELFFILTSMWCAQAAPACALAPSCSAAFSLGCASRPARVLQAAPGVLHLWRALPCVFHPGGDVRGDHHRAVLLPAMQRGLPLVVALVLHLRLIGAVHVPLLRLLLCNQAGDHEAGVDAHVLRCAVGQAARARSTSGARPAVR
jgi:transmembrane 9 superfamily protein 2/4